MKIFHLIKNLKIFIRSNSLYPKSRINFEKFEIINTNFLIKKKDFNILRKYFHKSENKPFNIKKSKVFVIDENDETLIISPIKKINFTTSQKDDFKKLNIKGNLFDLNLNYFEKIQFSNEFTNGNRF